MSNSILRGYPIIYYDFETTGADPVNDRIVELAFIKTHFDGRSERRSMYINPERPIPAEATEVHGITDAMVATAKKFTDVGKLIYDFIVGFDLCGYNSNRFDLVMLYCELKRCGINWEYNKVNHYDACTIFKRKEERTLSAAAKFYLKKDHTGAHKAIDDVSITKEIFEAQLARYPDLLPNDSLMIDQTFLNNYSNYDSVRVDLTGVFEMRAGGALAFAKGKYKGIAVNPQNKDHISYLNWMQGADFLDDAKAIARGLVEQLPK